MALTITTALLLLSNRVQRRMCEPIANLDADALELVGGLRLHAVKFKQALQPRVLVFCLSLRRHRGFLFWLVRGVAVNEIEIEMRAEQRAALKCLSFVGFALAVSARERDAASGARQ